MKFSIKKDRMVKIIQEELKAFQEGISDSDLDKLMNLNKGITDTESSLEKYVVLSIEDEMQNGASKLDAIEAAQKELLEILKELEKVK